jgi:nuclear transport factor 2 (NTF2) superfamily protein
MSALPRPQLNVLRCRHLHAKRLFRRFDWQTHAEKVALASTLDSRWRNRSEFVNGRQEIVALLRLKWIKALDYRLIEQLWAFEGNHIAVRFAYEWHDDSGNWFRSYGNEN